MSVSQPAPSGIPEDTWCKNRLQQYTQKASMPLPMYETRNEGALHATQFRSRVWVDGTCFVSPNTFPNRKMAEQDAAKYALIGIREKVKNEGCSRILEDTIFCKTIMNEYALKMNLEAPTYVTNEVKVMLPVFNSSLVLNGVTFMGDAGKNKKEAEQFAARSAILSILGSETGTTMSEIVKSKFRFYDALKNVKDSSGMPPVHEDTVAPASMNQPEERGLIFLYNKAKEVEVSAPIVTGPVAAIPQSSIAPTHAIQVPNSDTTPKQPCNTMCPHVFKRAEAQISPAIQVPLSDATPKQPCNTMVPHVFKRAEPQISPAPIALPIAFVPPASEQPPPVCSTSSKKRKRKNKKAKQQLQCQPQPTVAMMPQTLHPACSCSVAR